MTDRFRSHRDGENLERAGRYAGERASETYLTVYDREYRGLESVTTAMKDLT
jgi:hypothetical protein